jgi:hypothetical protein
VKKCIVRGNVEISYDKYRATIAHMRMLTGVLLLVRKRRLYRGKP